MFIFYIFINMSVSRYKYIYKLHFSKFYPLWTLNLYVLYVLYTLTPAALRECD